MNTVLAVLGIAIAGAIVSAVCVVFESRAPWWGKLVSFLLGTVALCFILLLAVTK